MKHNRKTSLGWMIAVSAAGAGTLGCVEPPSQTQEIIDNLLQAGFPADDIMVVDGTVYVGRDAEVSLAASREMLRTGDSSKEQYRTTNTISTGLTKICINGSTFTGTFSTALDLAIQNYDELPLTFAMARAPSSGCSVTINAVLAPGVVGGFSGFPSGGLPFGTINIGDGLAPFSVDTIEHVITHEIGHTIGFRHSDYFNRSISCGGAAVNEESPPSGLGAILVPGTPSTAVVGGSIMNACFRTSETGEFTGGDVTALLAMYPRAPTTISFATATGNFLVAENGGGAHVAANRVAIGPWERFVIVDNNGGILSHNDVINLRAFNGQFVVAEGGGGGVVNANRDVTVTWEAFHILNLDGFADFLTGDHVALQSFNGQFVVAEGGGGGAGPGSVNANRTAIGPWETFVITLQ